MQQHFPNSPWSSRKLETKFNENTCSWLEDPPTLNSHRRSLSSNRDQIIDRFLPNKIPSHYYNLLLHEESSKQNQA